MSAEQIAISGILVATMLMFLWGRWRHDMVALGALLACVLAGLVPAAEAFSGFGHPAVITVAAVLVLSRALQTSGAVDALAQRVLPQRAGPGLTIAALTLLAAVLSAFMNNVGALALLMPVAIQLAAKQEVPAGRLLMPLAFGSILGGMTTLIGTPPNLIVAGFRAEAKGEGFAMFDFTPVGLAVAGAGIAFIALLGWRLVPARARADAEGFDVGAYLTEARVPEGAKAVGMRLREVEAAMEEAGAQVVGIIRDERRLRLARPWQKVRAGDILMLEAEPEGLASSLSALGLALEEAVRPDPEGQAERQTRREGAEAPEGAEEVVLLEYAVLPGSPLAGRSASDLRLRSRLGVNLLGVSRRGRVETARLRSMVLREGDVLLMQGPAESLAEFAAESGCVPLAPRELRLPDRRQIALASAIMLGAIAAAAFGLVPAAVAFAAGVLAAMATRLVPPRSVYGAVDWTVVVLLGALIPVAGAMESTGTADLAARTLLEGVAGGEAVLALGLILLVTMTISDFVNNAATAAVMCPIAVGTAAGLGANPDPFLMAVAVGASCAFLTPIGHQNNTLILGPGGFRFGDYWRLGLPLELIVLVVAVPVILLVWPL
ncbi:SLC13 family permease [Crenalkalicoccus roseus]|uniref:SLC13 family permease n=1 Tax=Crenalkalicoccus roseus TaxID=1485588 RepID=UPI001081A643|nr:SLC13 family permease [Crenalkalicoccus roseus]